jgi:hypothetical protein
MSLGQGSRLIGTWAEPVDLSLRKVALRNRGINKYKNNFNIYERVLCDGEAFDDLVDDRKNR